MTRFHTVVFITSRGINGAFNYVGPWYDGAGFTGFDSSDDATLHMEKYLKEMEEIAPISFSPSRHAIIEMSFAFVRGFGPNPARFP